MNREFIKTQSKELETLIETFAKLLGEEFEGIGPGQTFLTDEQYESAERQVSDWIEAQEEAEMAARYER